MAHKYISYIDDMIEAIDKILKYVDDIDGLEAFLANEMLIDAVTRNFEIIGEASNKVPNHVKERYSNLP
ncbi:MAG: HepT-like ribonuclease domain-containing protein, partial [Bacteroidota bacterium]